VVARIAAVTGFPPEVVRESYLAAFAELSTDARVHAYLPLFAAKRAIARLLNATAESGTQTHFSSPDAARGAVISGNQVAFAAQIQNWASLPGSTQPTTVADLA